MIRNIASEEKCFNNDTSKNEKGKEQPRSVKTNLCKRDFLHGANACKLKECKFNHVKDKSTKGVCFAEFLQKGSCKFNKDCHFNHSLPDEVANSRATSMENGEINEKDNFQFSQINQANQSRNIGKLSNH